MVGVDEVTTSQSKDSNKMQVYIKEELKEEKDLKTINIDVDNIKSLKKKKKVYTTPWTKIYKVIELDFSTNLIFLQMIL